MVDGKEIQISNHNWVLGFKQLKDVISEDEIGDKEMKAERLKDNHTKWWEVQKVRSYILPTIANENLKIVLSNIDHVIIHRSGHMRNIEILV